MATITFTAPNIGNKSIYQDGSQTTFTMVQSGAWPTSGYKITGVTLDYTMRAGNTTDMGINVYRTDTGKLLGTVRSDIGGYNIRDLGAGWANADYIGISGIALKGDGGYAGQLTTGDIVITVTTAAATGKCTAPTTVTLDAAIAEDSALLSWSGAKSGTGNKVNGYGVRWRDSEDGVTYGAWTTPITIAATGGSGAYAVEPPSARGSYRQFGVRTQGAAGSSYYSGYTVLSGPLRKNRAPAAPVIRYPASDITGCASPQLTMVAADDPDGQTQTLAYRVDGGDWATYVRAIRPVLTPGTHVVEARSMDALGAASPTVSVTFAVAAPVWSRTIASGDVIASGTISHQADILELLAAVNRQRAWFGLTALTLSGVGTWAGWRGNMAALRQGLNACFIKAEEPEPEWLPLTGWPSADVINQIRERVMAV